MTALFAYAADEVAFIASDTCRALGGLRSLAAKTFQWSDTLLVAQTGFGEGLQRLTGEMKSRQHYDPSFRGQKGVYSLFDRHRAYRLELERFNSKVPSVVGGTLLSVQLGSVRGPASIVTLDWVSGAVSSQTLPVYADGSDPTLFNQIAQSQLAALPANNLDLGQWATRCMQDVMACTTMVGVVDWPLDLAIIRRHHGVLAHVAMRIDGPQSVRHPAFHL